jgi:hypothetical protein
MNIDQAREYVVVLNGGSGCLIQPMTNEYTYVLTAKHNITNSNNILNNITHFKFTDGNWTSHEIAIANLTVGENYFPHPDKDIAIIKVFGLEGYDKAFRFDRITEEKSNFNLLGYPAARRENQPNSVEWFRIDPNIQILDSRANGLFEASIPGNASLEEVRGHSGGAILKVIDDKLYVAGIQNRMAAANEQLGRVHFTPLTIFDEIINLNPTLAPIFPSHLKCFSFLQNEAFNINAGFGQPNIEFTRNYLQQKTNQVIQSSLTPIGIKNMFQKRLLFYQQGDEVLQSKFIWLIWLEFLTILNILKDEEYTEEGLKEIFNTTRLICSDTKQDWADELSNIAYSNYHDLKKNGIVIIGISKPPADGETYVLDKKIPHIANAISEQKKKHDRGLVQIDKGSNYPLEEYKFIHIEYFKGPTIIKKHLEYANISDDNLLITKLKDEYKILLSDE